MISLEAMQEPFARLYPATSEGPRVAVEGIETANGPKIVLFSTERIDVLDANSRLRQEGFQGVMHLNQTRQLATIPVLGTGKTDYKALRAMIAADVQ
jgi:long-chain-fatty-acid--[acyl-carrier-protein] ligase